MSHFAVVLNISCFLLLCMSGYDRRVYRKRVVCVASRVRCGYKVRLDFKNICTLPSHVCRFCKLEADVRGVIKYDV